MHDREWLLADNSVDLDVTMSHDTVTIPVISCDNIMPDAWSAWRTAYREAYKLTILLGKRYKVEDEYHLHLWLTSDRTDLGPISKLGAEMGHAAASNPSLPINDWDWLRKTFEDCQSQLSVR